MSRIVKWGLVTCALASAFVAGIKSQSTSMWRVLNREDILNGLSIAEVQNISSGETYVIVWSANAVAIHQKTTTPTTVPIGLPPPVQSAR
jgi:hypothetical protein